MMMFRRFAAARAGSTPVEIAVIAAAVAVVLTSAAPTVSAGFTEAAYRLSAQMGANGDGVRIVAATEDTIHAARR